MVAHCPYLLADRPPQSSSSSSPPTWRGGHRHHCSPELPVLHWQGGGAELTKQPASWYHTSLQETHPFSVCPVLPALLVLHRAILNPARPQGCLTYGAPRTAVSGSWLSHEQSLPPRMKPPTPPVLFTKRTHSNHPLPPPCREGSSHLPPKTEAPSYAFAFTTSSYKQLFFFSFIQNWLSLH